MKNDNLLHCVARHGLKSRVTGNCLSLSYNFNDLHVSGLECLDQPGNFCIADDGGFAACPFDFQADPAVAVGGQLDPQAPEGIFNEAEPEFEEAGLVAAEGGEFDQLLDERGRWRNALGFASDLGLRRELLSLKR